ncbi:E3 ubiquitin ligase PQT3-like isoform X2 [Hibiscus syriacus]|uniref:E3 ubiquitin ligase PQT3-like isoform X2 n=1 Tax=Hibiscus syriacus TaxID=106335 RepID=UPI0019208BDD|nr:E3 ubiquitin ligase PQT3-like isoform X2 [Hibiscus syriacus]
MAVYYKFKSARDFDSIAMDAPFISVGTLKEKIFESKHLGRGTDFDLVVTNAQTNEEYLDEATVIPKNTSVLIRRVPGRPRMPIVAAQEPKVGNHTENVQPEKINFLDAESSAPKYPEETEWDEFGNDLYSVPDTMPVLSSNPVHNAAPTNKADEDDKIKALIDTPALDWQCQSVDGFGPGRGFGRGMGGRMGGRGFGLERKTPPQGYVCHRCKVPGHFIQHCPTNGDPNYDIKRVKPPTGIPKSMLMATPDGSYALPSGAVAVLKPNEAAFEKEIEGLPSTRSVGDLPPEFHCPLCKEVMKDAVLTSKCCFTSFCDKCIRDHIISKLVCVCGASNILADDLLPNKTLRDTIYRILESGNSSADNAGSTFQIQDMESTRCPHPKILSPTTSAASKGEQKPVSAKEECPVVNEKAYEVKAAIPPQQALEKVKVVKPADASEATLESMSVKESASQGSALLAEEEVQQKAASGEAGKKKKKKKVRLLANDLHWKTPQDLAAESYMISMGPSVYNPYWTGMQPGMDGFMGPYVGGMPYMGGYGLGPLDMPFGSVMPPDPFGAQGYMFHPPPSQRDLAEFGMGMNVAPPNMSREEFEARQADLRRRHENLRGGERDFTRDREFNREVSICSDFSLLKSKYKPTPQMLGGERRHEYPRLQSERSSQELSLWDHEATCCPSKRKPDQHTERDRDHGRDHNHHHRSESSKLAPETVTKSTSTTAAATMEKTQKSSVFSRISFPEHSKKHIQSSDAPASSGHHKSTSNGYKATCVSSSGGRKNSRSNAVDQECSDDDRHFKRKTSRNSRSPSTEWIEQSRHSRGFKERERSSYNKHR